MRHLSREGRRPLVGRFDEMSTVAAVLQAAIGGQAGALLGSAPAGVGKTALLREACAQVTDIGDVLWAPVSR